MISRCHSRSLIGWPTCEPSGTRRYCSIHAMLRSARESSRGLVLPWALALGFARRLGLVIPALLRQPHGALERRDGPALFALLAAELDLQRVLELAAIQAPG